MNTTQTEIIPQEWDEDRDIPFFRVTAILFPPAFCFGASVLLASYDDDAQPSVQLVNPRSADAPAPATAAIVPA